MIWCAVLPVSRSSNPGKRVILAMFSQFIMMHTTLRFAPKTNIEKAVKRITGAVVALAMIAAMPGVNILSLVGQSARAVDPTPIVAQFYDSFDGNGDPVGDDLLDYA